jgi:hypothetical protein
MKFLAELHNVGECKFVITIVVCAFPVLFFPHDLPLPEITDVVHGLVSNGTQLAQGNIPHLQLIPRVRYEMERFETAIEDIKDG